MQSLRIPKAAVCGPSAAAAPAARACVLRPRVVVRCAAVKAQQDASPFAAVARVAAAACAAVTLLAAPLPAAADLVQTVPVSQVTTMAKPLPKQTIDKPKVWVAFIGGAIAVFGITVAAENNPSWFPAISRANQAMAMSRKRTQEGSDQQAAVDVEAAEIARQQALVEEGMAAAREKQKQKAAAAAAAAAEQQQQQQREGGAHDSGGVDGVLGAQSALRSYKEQQASQQQQQQQQQEQKV